MKIVSIVTGASGGIGQALTQQLLAQGHCVVACDIHIAACEAFAKKLSIDAQTRFSYYRLDVTNRESFVEVIDDVVKSHGRLDNMFNNAGIYSTNTFSETQWDIWEKVIDINLLGVAYGSYAALKVMQKQNSGRIINFSSTAGYVPAPFTSAYVASKHAVVGFTTGLRQELKRSNINVSLVVPGMVKTGIFDNASDVGSVSSRTMSRRMKVKKLTPNEAAAFVLDGISKNKNEIIFPFYNKVLLFLHRIFPKKTSDFVAKGMFQSLK